MLFNSFEFILIFLPAVLVGYFALGRVHRRWAVGWLAAASVAFYGYWNPKYVALLLASVLFNFAAGRAVARARDSSPRIAWRLAAATIAVDVALLAVYKYADFFIGSVNAAFVVNLPVYGLVLPLGISFFTLTQIAFIADVATGKAREYDFAKYLLFVSYFPHLIAGPVLHHAQVMPQFDHDSTYRPRAERFAAGITFFSIGLAKKVLLADSLGEQATPVFEAARAGLPIDSLSAWTASVAYSLQLYFDFSGYSDMAVGLSRMLGVRLPFNFNSPYKSRSIIDFWRRWHMTLSRFLRDYVYVPLGGNRRGPLRRYANIMVTMLVGGLWHGANWTFVAWGALHGLMLLANHAWRAAATRLGIRVVFPPLAIVSTIATFIAVTIAWVPFRAANFPAAVLILEAMSSAPRGIGQWPTSLWVLMTGCLAIAFFAPNSQQIVRWMGVRSRPRGGTRAVPALAVQLAWGVATGTVFFLAFTRLFGHSSEFLYFQF